ncbi:MAG: nucleotidyl transferase AbiEii/AbiGii toxin family protein [Pyrinomonadaceae bacterium]
MKHLEAHTKVVTSRLNKMGVKFAVVGGIAVSFRSAVRTTNDLDLAVLVNNDAEAESIVQSLMDLGYRPKIQLESDVTGRMSTVRMISAGEREVFVDLLFASSGIEQEVVQAADPIEIFPGIILSVATRPALIALKVLSANPETRRKDIDDLQNLIEASKPDEIAAARGLVNLITERGYNRTKDLQKDLDSYIEQFKS